MTVRELINLLLSCPMDAEVKPLFSFRGDAFREYDTELRGKAVYEEDNVVELNFDGTGKGKLITRDGMEDISL